MMLLRSFLPSLSSLLGLLTVATQIFFRPGYENPKFVDAVELTHDDILEWTEKEIAKIRKEQGSHVLCLSR